MNSKVNILIVDDREDGLIALEAILTNTRFNLIKARSGVEVLNQLPIKDLAVILLDVQMPGMDGFETALNIRKNPEHKHTPIIFVTAINKDDGYVIKGYQSGAVDYIFKPFDENILRSKVSVFVDLYEKSKKIEEQARQIKENANSERYLRLAQLEVESLKRYQNLADSIPHSVWRAKADGTMDYFNQVWTDSTGLSKDQSLGNGWQSVFNPDDLRLFLKTWMKQIGKGESFQVECRIRNYKGEMAWNIIRVVAETRFNGEIIAWLGTCTDIHERKMIEEKLIKAQVAAESANQAKTNFLANMSHEIRTPLNSILGFAELMMGSESLTEEQIKNLATIRKNGQVLMKIIDEILDISRVETGHLEIENIQTETCGIFLSLQALLDIQAQERGLEFKISCATEIPTKIITDPTRYQQILVNIVGNSLKFTEKGKVDVEVSWIADEANSKQGILRCTVTDTGIGIADDEAKNLFLPFSQVDSSKTRKFGGTGLGLALSRRLANALHGDVYIKESQRNKGSIFVIDIRVEIAENSKMTSSLGETTYKDFMKNSKFDKTSLKDTKVLVVDDSSDNRNLISHFLSAAGAKVDMAVDGHDGVEKATSNDYQVILMDIQMPHLDGYSATKKLRQGGYKKPIIALTAHALNQERMNSLQAGCDDHLTKPIDRKTLIEQVIKYLDLK